MTSDFISSSRWRAAWNWRATPVAGSWNEPESCCFPRPPAGADSGDAARGSGRAGYLSALPRWNPRFSGARGRGAPTAGLGSFNRVPNGPRGPRSAACSVHARGVAHAVKRRCPPQPARRIPEKLSFPGVVRGFVIFRRPRFPQTTGTSSSVRGRRKAKSSSSRPRAALLRSPDTRLPEDPPSGGDWDSERTGKGAR